MVFALIGLIAHLSPLGSAYAEGVQLPPKAPESWSGERAMADIAAQLQFNPRSIGSPGHEQTIGYITDELAKTSVKDVKTQRWTYTGADKSQINLTNIIARFDPSNPRRVIVGTHYDSLVRAYRDPEKPGAPMPGANNSASGVAVLLETARVLSEFPDRPVGVDLVFFDGEEGPLALGAGDPNWKALGSPYFAAHLEDFYPGRKPEKGVIFDMVCFKDLKLHPELSSLQYAEAEVTRFWKLGRAIAPSVYRPTYTKYPIGDDHTALARAGIPSFLIIDFDYEPWFNTTQDTLDKCSAKSLEAVGRTLAAYLYSN
jgi:glutaminyl-peptide cyclotransferase